jgi:hypothetical protein
MKAAGDAHARDRLEWLDEWKQWRGQYPQCDIIDGLWDEDD